MQAHTTSVIFMDPVDKLPSDWIKLLQAGLKLCIKKFWQEREKQSFIWLKLTFYFKTTPEELLAARKNQEQLLLYNLNFWDTKKYQYFKSTF